MTIPVYIMEEHYEAYYYWNYFVEKGLIPASGNYLLHVDHHDDLSPGSYDWDFKCMPNTLEEAKRFTYEKLGIADFIYPAVYKGIFSTLHTFLSVRPKEYEDRDMVLKGREGELVPANYVPFIHAKYKKDPNSPYKFFKMRQGSLKPLTIEEPLVLDMDLDYFYWDDALTTTPPKRVEISREEYDSFQEDPYHPFRIFPKRLFTVEQEGEKHYLRYHERILRERIPEREKVEKRIYDFTSWLSENHIVPKVINICRSRFSGYLPREAFPFVEEEFLARLGKITDIKICEIGE